MIEFLVENYFALIEGGLIVSLWLVARDRHKAVDRLMHWIVDHEMMISVDRDAPGRVIARSVRRMAKEKP